MATMDILVVATVIDDKLAAALFSTAFSFVV